MAGSILGRPEVQEGSRSFCRLPSGEPAASRLPGAAAPRGLHGSGSPRARDARAGGGEAAAAQEPGRCLSPTSELFSPAVPARPVPGPAPDAPRRGPGRVLGCALVYRRPAGRERPCPGLAATCRGFRPLPLRVKLCRLSVPLSWPGRSSTSPARPAREGDREAGAGERRLRAASRSRPRPYPSLPRLGAAGRRERAGDEPGPTPANHVRAPPTRSP
jgi:hypothetical protein